MFSQLSVATMTDVRGYEVEENAHRLQNSEASSGSTTVVSYLIEGPSEQLSDLIREAENAIDLRLDNAAAIVGML